jgi:hypothetical protein
MKEARAVLEMLRCREDVSDEMALLVEGLGSGGDDTAIEEYVVGPASCTGEEEQQQQVTLYGPEQGLSWVAQPCSSASDGGSILQQQGSMYEQLKDPVVAAPTRICLRLRWRASGAAHGAARSSPTWGACSASLPTRREPPGTRRTRGPLRRTTSRTRMMTRRL